ncbi:MAG: hypothetical protein C3F12_01825 [Candidatus Methylomirabilota bacterium]|nr:hypothetical protein [Candidatus Methylomirabilis sp.]NJD69213.1 hypothetical protein [candidate division NC10 bacterium]PWB48522.1 MAG: hypothetical protein C3F12_01825 [candidate division NC10 bacterium]
MAYTRESIRDAVERAGDEHWQALIAHHTDGYPASRPTPGDVCRMEAERLNALGLGNATEFELMETRVERADQEVIITHVLRYRPLGIRLRVEPYRGYA